MGSYSNIGSASTPKSGDGRPPFLASETPEGTEPRGPCLRVFLVEDSASIRDRLGDFLSEPGKVYLRLDGAEFEARPGSVTVAIPADLWDRHRALSIDRDIW